MLKAKTQKTEIKVQPKSTINTIKDQSNTKNSYLFQIVF